jgi:hypothetical protein
MQLKFDTSEGRIAYFGVEDFEVLEDSSEADYRLHPPHTHENGSVDVQGSLVSGIDSTALPATKDEETVSEGVEVVDWRSESMEVR